MPIRNRLSRRHLRRHFFSRDFWILHFILPLGLELSSKWGQNPHLIRLVFFNVPVYAFLFRHHFERTRLVNACSQYRFLPLGQDHFSPLLSLLFSLFFPSSRFWSRCCTCVCEWMDTCLKVNHDFKKLSVYKCLGCCNLKCLKMTLLVSKDRIGEGGY